MKAPPRFDRLIASLGPAVDKAPSLVLLVLKDLVRLQNRLTLLVVLGHHSWFAALSRAISGSTSATLDNRALARRVREWLGWVASAARAGARSSEYIKLSTERIARDIAEDEGCLRMLGAMHAAEDLLRRARAADASKKIGKMAGNFYRRRTTPDVQYPPQGRNDQTTDRLWADMVSVRDRLPRTGINTVTVVEMGCGTGRSADGLDHYLQSQELNAQQVTYHGVDISEKFLKFFADWRDYGNDANTLSRNLGANLWLWPPASDASPLPFRASPASAGGTLPTGGVVVVVNVMHEIQMRYLPTFLARLDRVLKPGGVVMFCEMQSLGEIEDYYALWTHRDFYEVLNSCGYTAFALGARQAKGYPLTYCYAMRQNDFWSPVARPPVLNDPSVIGQVVRSQVETRASRLLWDIHKLSSHRRSSGLPARLQYQHFHNVQSLVNLLRDLRGMET